MGNREINVWLIKILNAWIISIRFISVICEQRIRVRKIILGTIRYELFRKIKLKIKIIQKSWKILQWNDLRWRNW